MSEHSDMIKRLRGAENGSLNGRIFAHIEALERDKAELVEALQAKFDHINNDWAYSVLQKHKGESE